MYLTSVSPHYVTLNTVKIIAACFIQGARMKRTSRARDSGFEHSPAACTAANKGRMLAAFAFVGRQTAWTQSATPALWKCTTFASREPLPEQSRRVRCEAAERRRVDQGEALGACTT